MKRILGINSYRGQFCYSSAINISTCARQCEIAFSCTWFYGIWFRIGRTKIHKFWASKNVNFAPNYRLLSMTVCTHDMDDAYRQLWKLGMDTRTRIFLGPLRWPFWAFTSPPENPRQTCPEHTPRLPLHRLNLRPATPRFRCNRPEFALPDTVQYSTVSDDTQNGTQGWFSKAVRNACKGSVSQQDKHRQSVNQRIRSNMHSTQ